MPPSPCMQKDAPALRRPRYCVAARDLRAFADLLEAPEGAVDAILERLGLGPALLSDDPTAMVRLADYFRLLEQVSLVVQDETCHLSRRPLIPGSTHFVWRGIAGASTLSEAMKRVAEAYNVLHGGHYNRVEIKNGALIYSIDDRDFPYRSDSYGENIYFAIECVMVFLHATLSLATGTGLDSHLRKVLTRRPAAAHQGQLDFLAAPIRWNAPCYALVYDERIGHAPIEAKLQDIPAPHALYGKLVTLIEKAERGEAGRTPLSQQLSDLIGRGVRNQSAAASALGMSVATLRRRLDAEGTSFRALRCAILDRAAKEQLREGASMVEVADSLGYSDFRSFSRAFRSVNSLSPAQWIRSAGR